MTLPEISIKRHIFALMLSLLIVLFGVISYQRIGVDRYPQIQFPAVSVITALRGANPEVIDSAVTNVIESAVNSTPGIERIESQSLPGTSLIVVIFKLGKDVDVAFNEVQTKVSQAVERLPDDIEAPVVAKLETGSQAIMWLSLEGDRTDPQLDTYARTVLKKRLETIDGVGEVQLGGVQERAIRVNVDLDRAAALGVTAQDITAALANEHLQLPGGFLVGGQTEHLIKLDQEYHSVAEMQRLVVGHRDGAPILLKDVARVEDSGKDRRQAAYQKGKVPLSAASTACTWPSTFTLRHSCAIVPSAATRKVERITPSYSRPMNFLRPQAPSCSARAWSSSLSSGKARACLAMNLACSCNGSGLTPNTATPSLARAASRAEKSQASVVQPGVRSLG